MDPIRRSTTLRWFTATEDSFLVVTMGASGAVHATGRGHWGRRHDHQRLYDMARFGYLGLLRRGQI